MRLQISQLAQADNVTNYIFFNIRLLAFAVRIFSGYLIHPPSHTPTKTGLAFSLPYAAA